MTDYEACARCMSYESRALAAEQERDAAVAKLARHEADWLDHWNARCHECGELAADLDALREVVEAARTYAILRGGCEHHPDDCPGVEPECRAARALDSAFCRLDARDATAQDKTPGGVEGTTMKDPMRRARIDKMTPAELAIRAAVEAVEKAGCDVRLTDAVVLLDKARACVADYVDDVPRAESQSAPTGGLSPEQRAEVEAIAGRPLSMSQRAEVEAIVREVVAGACEVSDRGAQVPWAWPLVRLGDVLRRG